MLQFIKRFGMFKPFNPANPSQGISGHPVTENGIQQWVISTSAKAAIDPNNGTALIENLGEIELDVRPAEPDETSARDYDPRLRSAC